MTHDTHEATLRPFAQTTRGRETSDGAGVTLRRMIGTPDVAMLDPLLMLDAFGSDDPSDYIAGFPPHPHRGFETVTYLLAGKMRHKDNAGHEGVIEAGGVQWMTAGRGIVHSEMPEQENGLLAGFQLWINLPATDKMTAPAYQEFGAFDIPVEKREDGGAIKVIAGRTDAGTQGAVKRITTQPLYLDVTLKGGTDFSQSVPEDHNGFVYVIDGALTNLGDGRELPMDRLAVLGAGNHLSVRASGGDSRFLLVGARRLGEPVAWRGPFVMNTDEELAQAFDDFKNGRF